MTRRQLFEQFGAVAAMSLVARPLAGAFGDGFPVSAQALPLTAIAGVDRVVMKHGKTYLNGWAGYGEPPRPRTRRAAAPRRAPPPPPPPGPAPSTVVEQGLRARRRDVRRSRRPRSRPRRSPRPATTSCRSPPTTATTKAASTLTVKVELPPPATQLDAGRDDGVTRSRARSGTSRTKALIVVVDSALRRADQPDRSRPGRPAGIDNFIEAAKALRGEPHGQHKGYVFSNAWVHQTVEAMSLALMVDPQGDQEIVAAQANMQATLDDWIPNILAAQHPDGYLQTAFTLRDAPSNAGARSRAWTVQRTGRAAAITKATPPATSSSRRSITTR